MTTVLIDENTKEGRDLIRLLREKRYAQVIEEKEDWWDTISNEEKAAIQKGLSDLDENKTTSYENLKAHYAHLL